MVSPASGLTANSNTVVPLQPTEPSAEAAAPLLDPFQEARALPKGGDPKNNPLDDPAQGRNVERYYVMTGNTYGLFSAEDKPKVVRREGERLIVRMPIHKAEKLSHLLHGVLHQEAPGGGLALNAAQRGEFGYFDATEYVRERKGFDGVANLLDTSAQEPVFEPREVRVTANTKTLLNLVNKQRFADTLEAFSKAFPNRSALSPEGMKTTKWLIEKVQAAAGKAARDDIVVTTVPTGLPYLQDSVVVRIPGTSNKPGVLLGGHMDTLRGTMPGADDDGSGTITALEVLRVVLESGLEFERDIYIAFYAAEEEGLVGSGQVAKKFKTDGTKLDGVMQLDMTGYKSAKDKHDVYIMDDYTDKNLTKFTQTLATKVLAISDKDVGHTRCYYACSDHASFTANGYPAVFLFETAFPNYNRRIHSRRDTFDQVNIEHAMKYLQIATAFVSELAQPR